LTFQFNISNLHDALLLKFLCSLDFTIVAILLYKQNKDCINHSLIYLTKHYFFKTKHPAMMSWRACFLSVKPAITKPIAKIIPDTILLQYLPFALPNETRLPLRSVTTISVAYAVLGEVLLYFYLLFLLILLDRIPFLPF